MKGLLLKVERRRGRLKWVGLLSRQSSEMGDFGDGSSVLFVVDCRLHDASVWNAMGGVLKAMMSEVGPAFIRPRF